MAATAPSMGVRRIAVIAHSPMSLIRFRGALIRALHTRRHRILALAPGLDGTAAATLANLGIATATLPDRPVDGNAFAERQMAKALAEQLAAWKPHIVVSSGPAIAALGTKAGRDAGAETTMLIVNGRPSIDRSASPATGWFSARREQRQRLAGLKAASHIVFHNTADQTWLEGQGVIGAKTQRLLMPGSGIDLAHFAVAPLPDLSNGLVFVMLARFDQASGIQAFCEAAQRVRAKSQSVRFQLAGPTGHGSTAIAPAQLARFQDAVSISGPVEDTRPLIAGAHILVNPAVGEGLPGAVLEAMSMGRPVIVSSDPGCRQTVDERVNGVVVPPGDAAALAEAMESFLRRPDLIPAMARASRIKAERRFDEREVTGQLVAALGLA